MSTRPFYIISLRVSSSSYSSYSFQDFVYASNLFTFTCTVTLQRRMPLISTCSVFAHPSKIRQTRVLCSCNYICNILCVTRVKARRGCKISYFPICASQHVLSPIKKLSNPIYLVFLSINSNSRNMISSLPDYKITTLRYRTNSNLKFHAVKYRSG